MVKTKKILSYLFVVLFIIHYADESFFVHKHEFEGRIVVHSHIHLESHHDHPNGTHEEESLILIFKVSNAEHFTSFYNYIICPLEFQLQQNKFIETTHWVDSIYFQNLSLRAPPIV